MVSLLFLWLKFILHGTIEGCREGGGRPSHHLRISTRSKPSITFSRPPGKQSTKPLPCPRE
ncbi:hypothetical protein FQ038_26130 [Escherichia coli]|nr:hypothetical protein [Escherichia coli]